MSVSKKKKASSKTKRGRSHDSLSKAKSVKCAKCGKATMPHLACPSCGYYKGREVKKIAKPKSTKK